MAIGTINNMVIRPDFFEEGLKETIDQNVNVFNANAANAIRLVSMELAGDFAKERFVQRLTNVVQSRDDTSTDDVADTPLEQEEQVSVKIKRRIGPFSNTLDSFRSAGMSEEELSFYLGGQVGEEAAKDYFDNIAYSMVGAISNDADLVVDATTGDLSHAQILAGMRAFGDASGRLSALVMHSKPFFDLMENQLDNADVGGQVVFATIYNANIASFQRPIIVTDSEALKVEDGVEAGTDLYRTFLLSDNAGAVTESNAPFIVDDLITGEENLRIRLQGEHAFNVEVKGYSYDEDAGGRLPNETTLSSDANWASIVGNLKDKAGVIIETQ